MYSNIDIFKIETNHVVPARGKVLISEPFLCDHMFGRSVILLVDHTHDGTMGLVLNKPLPLFLNDVLQDFNCPESIPIYKGGPLSTDTLFYLHTLESIAGALPIGKGFYLNLRGHQGLHQAGESCQRPNQILPGILRLGIRTTEPGNRGKYLAGRQREYSFANG